MADLKPCPFCGGPVYLERAADTRSEIHGVRKWWGVICRNTENLGGTCAIWQNPSASEDAAIERWNRRASEQPQPSNGEAFSCNNWPCCPCESKTECPKGKS